MYDDSSPHNNGYHLGTRIHNHLAEKENKGGEEANTGLSRWLTCSKTAHGSDPPTMGLGCIHIQHVGGREASPLAAIFMHQLP